MRERLLLPRELGLRGELLLPLELLLQSLSGLGLGLGGLGLG